MADKQSKNDDSFAAWLSRLSADQFVKLQSLLDTEQKRRGPSGKSPGSMTDSEWRKFLDDQFSAADNAQRENDLRQQLANKPSKAKAKISTTKDVGDTEDE